MKNTFKLYKQTLKKLSIPAIIMGALLIVSTVLYLSANNPKEMTYYNYGPFFRGEPTSFAMAPGLPVFMVLGAAAMTYMAFAYLNKRNASDFYHSLPYTRTENFVGRIGAVMTYQIGVTLVTLVTSWLTLVTNDIAFNASFFPLLLLSYTAGSLLVAGAVTLAMSITGTLVSNTLVSGLILFLPRMFLFIYAQGVVNLTYRRVLIGHTNILLNPVYNLVTGSLLDVSRMWEYYGLSETLINPGSIIYTAVLGAVYIALASVLMKKRKSELAGQGAPSLMWACAFSALASLPVLLFGVQYFSSTSFTEMSHSAIMTLLIIAAIALVVFIVLAFVLSTRWKAVVKALPLFAAMVVIAFGAVLGANLTAERMGTALPDRDKLAYVRVTEQGEWEYRYKTVYNYNALLGSQVIFTDEAVLDLFHDALDQNNQNWLEQKNDNYSSRYAESSQVLCEYKLKSGRSLYRIVSVNVNDLADFREAMMKNTAYVDAYTALAEDAEVFYYEDDDIVNEKALYEAAWDAYKDEFSTLTQTEKLSLNLRNTYQGIIGYTRSSGNRSSWDVLNTFVYGELSDAPYTQMISVSASTPKTADFYMKAVNDTVKDSLASDLGRALDLPEGTTFDLSFSLLGDVGNGTARYYNSDMIEDERAEMPEFISKDQLQEVFKIALSKDLSTVSITEPLMMLRYSFYSMYEEDFVNEEVYVPLSDEEFDTLIAFYNTKWGQTE